MFASRSCSRYLSALVLTVPIFLIHTVAFAHPHVAVLKIEQPVKDRRVAACCRLLGCRLSLFLQDRSYCCTLCLCATTSRKALKVSLIVSKNVLTKGIIQAGAF